MGSTVASYAPSVLLIEDDFPAREYLTRRFYQETSLGVVVAKNLSEAKQLIDASDVHFDAIVADLYFDVGSDAPGEDLRDGIDVLSYGLRRRSVLGYVNSYWADRRDYVDKAAQLNVEVREWFHKQPMLPGDVSSPWAQVERDLIYERLGGSQLNAGHSSLVEVTETIRQQLSPIRRTYLQSLGADTFRVLKPIEVLTWSSDGDDVRASAPRLGLLTDGAGETVGEAIEALCALIRDHKLDLDDQSENLEGYAAFVKKQLDQYISVIL